MLIKNYLNLNFIVFEVLQTIKSLQYKETSKQKKFPIIKFDWEF
jgi:hypothetical protein